MGSPGTPPSAPEDTVDPQDTVDAELRGNEGRILLVKAAGLGLVSLISLSQLGTGAKFGSGGPKALLPVTLTLVIVAAVIFGVAYRNMAFASAQLDARLARTVKTEKGEEKPLLTKKSEVPSDIKKTSALGWRQTLLGLLLTTVAVIFYLLSVWWPAAASVPARSPSSTRTPPSRTATSSSSAATVKQSPSTATPTSTPAASVTVTPSVIVTTTLPPAIPTVPGRG